MILSRAPAFDPRRHDARHLAMAARAWHRLLVEEEHSRVMTARLVADLERLGAPRSIVDSAQKVADDEARHVALCGAVVGALGGEATVPAVVVPSMPEDDTLFERAMARRLVAGFAVAETMSVGGFVATRAVTIEPLMRWTLAELARDEVHHGAFGEEAGAWALRAWSAEQRRSLWPACVAAMQSVERRAGGPVSARAERPANRELERLGAPAPRIGGSGLLGAIPRWVLPRLARLGVLPPLRVTRGLTGRSSDRSCEGQ